MRAATSVQRAASTLTPAQEAEMRRMDPNGDGIIDEKEGRAIARSSAKLRASNMQVSVRWVPPQRHAHRVPAARARSLRAQ